MSAATRCGDAVPAAPFAILVPNAGAMTLEGTNTWVLPGPAGEPAVVVDPGPDHLRHLSRVQSACPKGIAEIWITHGHQDHVGGAPRLASWAGCPIRAYDPRLSTGEPLPEGEVDTAAGRRVVCLALPGHTGDSVGFVLPDDAGTPMLCGDTVLGRGSTQIAWPDGDLGRYLETLDRMAAAVVEYRVGSLLPGHGPVVRDPAERIARYRAHRLERLDQIRAALAAGQTSVGAILDRVYGDLVGSTRVAAERTVRAQLAYLELPGQ